MDTSLIITLIVAILTVAAGVVGAAITIIHKGYKERLSKHVQPIVSIFDDRIDDIDNKCLKLDNKINQYSNWFTNLDNVEDMLNHNYYYFGVKNNDKYKMKDCHIKIVTFKAGGLKTTGEYGVGDLSINRNAIIPIKNENDIIKIICLIKYEAESGELLLFTMDMSKDNGTMIPKVGIQKLQKRNYQKSEIKKRRKEDKKNKDDNVIDKNEMKGKIIDVIKYNTSLSYSTQEILTALNGRKLYKGIEGN